MGRGAKVSGGAAPQEQSRQALLDAAPSEDAVPEGSVVHTRRRRSVKAEPTPAQEIDGITIEPPIPEAVAEPEPAEEMTDDPAVLTPSETPTVTVAFEEEELRRILCVPKMKRQVPTLVRFREDGQVPVRSVLVDIGEPILRAGWEYYRSTNVNASVQDYMGLVYEITQTRLPRMYRVVAELDLTKRPTE